MTININTRRVHDAAPDVDLPLYHPIKKVRAARIESISALVGAESLQVTIPGMDGLLRLRVEGPWLALNKPVPGGYIVSCDGLSSFWPAKMFEMSFKPCGVSLVDYARDFCRKAPVDGYAETLSDQEVINGLPGNVLDSLALRFIADKVERI